MSDVQPIHSDAPTGPSSRSSGNMIESGRHARPETGQHGLLMIAGDSRAAPRGHTMPSSPSSTTSPLGGLIRRHRAGRSNTQLAEACGGVISPSRWGELQKSPVREGRPVDPALIEALALALGLTEDTVRHYVLASRTPAVR